MTAWAVTGWAQSRAVRDRVTRALETGAGPLAADGPDATLIADHPAPPSRPASPPPGGRQAYEVGDG